VGETLNSNVELFKHLNI